MTKKPALSNSTGFEARFRKALFSLQINVDRRNKAELSNFSCVSRARPENISHPIVLQD